MTGNEAEPGPGEDAAARASASEIPSAAADDRPIRVTTLEFFFDLIFAFTLTQLAVLLTTDITDVRVCRCC